MAQFQNFFATKLYADIGSSDTTITLETAPTVTAGRMVLEARNATQREIIKYTGVSGNQLTGVTRGLGGTTAKTHLKNALVEMNLTADDLQDLYDSFNNFTATVGNGWYTSLANFTSPTYLGNHSYRLTTSIDLTSVISIGMRFSTQRTVAAPTMCTSLNGTTQYYSKSSPTGMTFTDDFVGGAWVKLTSYPGAFPGGQVISRYNGTSGWMVWVTSTGQIRLQGFNAGIGNTSYVETCQSIPLNKWVHIAGQLDMSAFTATTTTSYIMLDGVDVPCSLVRAGTNPTALVQAGNLEVGSTNAGTGFFPGKIAQAFVFNAKVTQATMRGYISQGLTGSETNLVSAYSFNNSSNDLTANANHLTANGAATANTVDSPFTQDASGVPGGTYDYGIVTGITSTTLTVQVPEGCAIPTSGGIAGARYSIQKAPFGFPLDPAKWTVTTRGSSTCAKSNPTAGTWYGDTGLSATGPSISVPIGAWDLRFESDLVAQKGAATTADALISLSTSASSETDTDMTARQFIGGASGTLLITTHVTKRKTLVLTAATTYYLIIKTSTSSMTSITMDGAAIPIKIKAVCAYL